MKPPSTPDDSEACAFEAATTDGRSRPKQPCPACGRERRSVRDGACNACRPVVHGRQALERIAAYLDRDDVLVLDTETTGMHDSEVIEVGVVNTRGQVLLDTLVAPKRREMNPYAFEVHNISLAMLEGQPTWPDVLPELERVTRGATVLAWNAQFDAKALAQTSAVWEVLHPEITFECAMRLHGLARQRKRMGLQKALDAEGVAHLRGRHDAHRALGDAMMTLGVLRVVAGAPRVHE